jgi:hypothetical protein
MAVGLYQRKTRGKTRGKAPEETSIEETVAHTYSSKSSLSIATRCTVRPVMRLSVDLMGTIVFPNLTHTSRYFSHERCVVLMPSALTPSA